MKVHKKSGIIIRNKEDIEQYEESINLLNKDLDLKDLKKKILSKGNKKPKKVISIKETYERNQEVKNYVKKRAKGICECCGEEAPFEKQDEEKYLETHHIKPLSKNGDDLPYNVAAVCPNCHCALHHSKNKKELRKELKEKVKSLEKGLWSFN